MAMPLFQLFPVFGVTLGLFLVATDTSAALKLTHSRFIAARRGNNVSFNCFLNSMAKWYKEAEKGKYLELKNTSRVEVTRNESMVMVHIRKLQQADSGIYVCDSNISDSRRIQQQCCSTELRVMGISTFEQVQSRHTLKDAIIVIQSTLLVLFVSIPLLLTLGKGESKDAPGEDHTYEGLTVELADTYEDIGPYQERTEKWNIGEHPCEE
ncbi:B-cell antigen receptor complex-associated protein beta chain [Varanus komodoensis]|uniref:B-cell antigen receptor complex-associated protein beta chain n=1 Tax=Varanus komodoensis TaxID=61221 RepID=UPI001CF788BF|nr:B-cell antigen receptor complex-associated protein beta chain [Varanus komodoensis]